MKSNLIVGLMLALPVALFTGCTDDDDSTGNTGGGGAGAGRAGSAGHAGRAGNSQGGAAGSSDGDNAGSAGEAPSNGGRAPVGAAGADTSAGAGGDLGGAGGGEGGAAGAVAALNDAQILKALSTANSGEVTAAQAAKPALQNATAVSFAQMMIDEHTAANTQTLALVSTKHLAPEASDASESLEADTAELLTTLSNTAPAAFDKVYIDSQVTMHQRVLTLIDSRLVPDASDADVKALLGTLRTSVATHLASAQTISAALP